MVQHLSMVEETTSFRIDIDIKKQKNKRQKKNEKRRKKGKEQGEERTIQGYMRGRFPVMTIGEIAAMMPSNSVWRLMISS